MVPAIWPARSFKRGNVANVFSMLTGVQAPHLDSLDLRATHKGKRERRISGDRMGDEVATRGHGASPSSETGNAKNDGKDSMKLR